MKALYMYMRYALRKWGLYVHVFAKCIDPGHPAEADLDLDLDLDLLPLVT